MSFSLSTFAIEVDGMPTIVFQARWHADADRICQDWLHHHWDELAAKGPAGVDLPPIFKLRLARSSERAAYAADGNTVELFGDVKFVKLIGATADQSGPDADKSEPEPVPPKETSDDDDNVDHDDAIDDRHCGTADEQSRLTDC